MSIESILVAGAFILSCTGTFIFGGMAIYYFYKVLQTSTHRYTNIVPLLVLLPNSHRGEAKEHYMKFTKFVLLGGVSFLVAALINIIFT